MTVRFGMVGTGAMAAAMAQAFRFCPDAELVAVASRNEDRARAFAKGQGVKSAYGSLDALFDDDAVDAVYVANATAGHAETSIAALNAGKHVLCEKPFAMNAEEGARVLAAAKASGKLFMEGLWTLLLPAYRRAQEVVDQKLTGDPVMLTASYGYPTSPSLRPRLFNKDDGGVLLDLGIYPVSLALSLLGPAANMTANITRNQEGVDTHATIMLTHENGATSQLGVSFDALLSNAASIACREGMIAIPAPLFGAERIVIERAAPSSVSDQETAVGAVKAALKKNSLIRRIKTMFSNAGERHPYGANQYLPLLSHFTGLIEAQKTQSDIVSHDLSLSVARVLDRIRAEEKGGR